MKHLSSDATISALDAETSALDVDSGDICIWGSDVGDRVEVIRCDDIGTRRGDRAELPAISVWSSRQYR